MLLVLDKLCLYTGAKLCYVGNMGRGARLMMVPVDHCMPAFLGKHLRMQGGLVLASKPQLRSCAALVRVMLKMFKQSKDKLNLSYIVINCSVFKSIIHTLQILITTTNTL